MLDMVVVVEADAEGGRPKFMHFPRRERWSATQRASMGVGFGVVGC